MPEKCIKIYILNFLIQYRVTLNYSLYIKYTYQYRYQNNASGTHISNHIKDLQIYCHIWPA